MPHPLQQKIKAVGDRAHRFVMLYGIAWVVVLGLLAASLLGLADYQFRFHDFGVRLISSTVFLAVFLLSIWRFLYPALIYRQNNIELARRIERRFPDLKDQLSSTIAFLEQESDSPTAGSAELRRAIVAKTTSDVESLNLLDSLDFRKPRQALTMALVASAALVLMFCLAPSSVSMAARRLLAPWSNIEWPRTNVLQFEEQSERLAAGSDFEAILFDANGSLPDRVDLHIRFEDEAEEQVQAMQPLGEKMVHRINNVARTFQYRAVGGDDNTMAWKTLEVVEPPRVESLQIVLHPPEYTRLPREKSDKNIRALQGTRIEIIGQASKPLRHARVRVENSDGEQVISADISQRGVRFSLTVDASHPWIVEKSAVYWIELEDDEGIIGGVNDRWELRAIEDHPPTVSVEQPSSNTYLVPQAMIELKAAVKDDLAIKSIELRYKHSEQTDQPEEEAVSLYEESAQVGETESGDSSSSHPIVHSRTVEYSWDLAKMSNLKPGTELAFHLAASDYRPQWGQSNPQLIHIISVEELEDRLAQRQTELLSRIAEGLDLERQTRSETTSLEIQLQQTGHLIQQDVDHLQSAELNQRRVQEWLGRGSNGAQNQVASLLSQIENNRLDRPDAVRKLSNLANLLRGLEKDELPSIQRELLSALKTTRQQKESLDPQAPGKQNKQNEATLRSLSIAGAEQDKVIQTLDQLLGELTEWDSYRRFAREFSRIRREQEELSKQTEQLRLHTLTKGLEELTTQEKSNLECTAQRQLELARRFDKTVGRMQQMRDKLENSDPLASATLGDALYIARSLAIGEQMRESGFHIRNNRVGQAPPLQKEILQSLLELLDVLANRREHELQRIVQKLQEAAGELNDLVRQEEENRKAIQEAAKIIDPKERQRRLDQLAQKQQELAKKTSELARRLQRLQAEKAGESLDQASSQLGESSKASKEGKSDESLQSANQAQQQLQKAQQDLATEMEKAKQESSKQQLAKFEKLLRELENRQKSILEQTLQLDAKRNDQAGPLTRSQAAKSNELADKQRALATDTKQLAGDFLEAEAFVMGLEGVYIAMSRSAKGLQGMQTGQKTQQAENAALDQIGQMIEALKPEPQDSNDQNATNNQPPPDAQAPQDQPAQKNAQRTLAELKLLKLMQQGLNRRTIELEAEFGEGEKLSPTQQQRLDELAHEQGRLAALIDRIKQRLLQEQQDAGPQGQMPGPNQRNIPPKKNPFSPGLKEI